MHSGDRARKQALIDYGFRLPSAYDNRPLSLQESYARFHQVIYVSATPADWEVNDAAGLIINQVIRPTGLLDPIIEVRPATEQVDDCLAEIRAHTAKGGRVLVTTLTKRLAEELTKYLTELEVQAKYLHSDIDTLERMQIIEELRRGTFSVLVGINLLREGLDIPEVSLVAILDADKQGFLRSKTALIQTCGRAARNVDGRVIMYADQETAAIRATLEVTQQRRLLQAAYNTTHGITPHSTQRSITPLVVPDEEDPYDNTGRYPKTSSRTRNRAAEPAHHYLTLEEINQRSHHHAQEMRRAAQELSYEEAAYHRDQMRHYQTLELSFGNHTPPSDRSFSVHPHTSRKSSKPSR
jgi:excinuclease ABC subunit B